VPDLKLTDYLTFHRAVDKFRVCRGAPGVKHIFISIGSGGKGSEYIALSADQALELARYLTVEAHRVLDAPATGSEKAKK
jgi:hypothetical protein